MEEIKIPWASWYGDTVKKLPITNNWNISICNIQDSEKLNKKDITNSFKNPIGMDKISNIAKNKKKILILIDDLTRRTPTRLILPHILEELNQANISDEYVSILVATGAHRPLNRIDLIKKIGKKNITRYKILNHNPYDNLLFIGKSSSETPIYINKFLMNADFKIAIGSILPHYNTCFSGGCKIVVPGCAGIKTIIANHKIKPEHSLKDILSTNNNRCRKDIEEIAMKVGLDFIVNIVPNSRYEIAGIFSGHPIQAHREGVKFACKVLDTRLPFTSDVAIFNNYPEDTELTQLLKSLNIYFSTNERFIREDGIIIIISACSEGAGVHNLYQKGMPMYYDWSNFLKDLLNKRRVIIYTPDLNEYDVREYFSEKIEIYSQWNDIVKKVNDYYNHKEINVNLFPVGPIQLVSR
ncbi:nickel-dependent lactate racemase [Candidatus Atribacteria bacterium 1244-E10-H5-B2]|nr:MAG: nickel-dependent lactate racemase [Candidatus Atribacteria bacterium 1244-E10-H5-B2]